MPNIPKECREEASKCMHLGQKSTSPEMKKAYADLAETWLELADDLEALQRLIASRALTLIKRRTGSLR